MTNIRNMFFIAIVAVALIAPAGNYLFSLCAGMVPRSYLEGRTRPKLPATTWKTVAQGNWQSAFDAALAFSVPNRDEVLLADARWQRKMIGVAAWLFEFDAYPTFYGSRHCRVGSDRIARLPSKNSLAVRKKLENAAKRYSKFMQKHPNVRWHFAIVDRSSYSMTNPLHNLGGCIRLASDLTP